VALTLSEWLNYHPEALIHRVAYYHLKLSFGGLDDDIQMELCCNQFIAEHQKNKEGYRLKTIYLEDLGSALFDRYGSDARLSTDIASNLLQLPLLSYSPKSLKGLTRPLRFFLSEMPDFSVHSQLPTGVFERILYFTHFFLCKLDYMLFLLTFLVQVELIWTKKRRR
jgi:hypothetical protein